MASLSLLYAKTPLHSLFQVDTILTLDANKGKVLSGFGKDLFYMPHGLVSEIDMRTKLHKVQIKIWLPLVLIDMLLGLVLNY